MFTVVFKRAISIKHDTVTAKRYLNSLVKSGLIEFKGAQKTGGYHILEK